MVYKALKSQADYVVRTDESGREVLETSNNPCSGCQMERARYQMV